jgi:hypothetical protein
MYDSSNDALPDKLWNYFVKIDFLRALNQHGNGFLKQLVLAVVITLNHRSIK